MKPPNKITPPRNAAQPGLSSTLKIYGSRRLDTVKVRLKDSDNDCELIINAKDFDSDRYVRLD